MKVVVCCVGILLCYALQAACFAKPCAHFKFSSHSFAAEENTILNLPFGLDTRNCPPDRLQKFSIVVSKRQKSGEYHPVCSLGIKDGDCVSPVATGGCRCSSSSGEYGFTKSIDRTDNTEWKWWLGDAQIAEKEEISIVVHYPARVNKLQLKQNTTEDRNGQFGDITGPIKPYSYVEIVCDFENGNPPVPIRILDRNGKPLNEETGKGNSNRIHVSPKVACEDAGLIRCEAPGATKNQSVTLLVKCVPEFPEGLIKTYTFPEGSNDSAVNFDFRTHSDIIKDCSMITDSGKREKKCLSYEVSGTPPDLHLTVPLETVNKEDEGEWRLYLTNEVGTGHVKLVLHVTDKNGKASVEVIDTRTNRVRDEELVSGLDEDSNGDNNITWIIVGAGSGGFIVVIVVIVVVCKIRGRRGRDEEDEDTPAYADPAAEAMGLRELDIRRRAEPSVEMHDYCDIPELNRASGAQAPYPENEYLEPGPLHLPPPPESLRPDSNPGGYEATSSYAMLNPVYETMRSAYADLRRLSQRLSRRLSRLPPPMFDDDD